MDVVVKNIQSISGKTDNQVKSIVVPRDDLGSHHLHWLLLMEL